jgi:glycosyltransferase involved in cell wall biosynthesis
VGVPVYNGERYLAGALDGILAQTFRDFVLLISDNASVDGTREICESYARRDSRIQYVRHPANGGAAWNFNELVRRCRTPLFCWHAADDKAEPGYLRACVDLLETCPDAALAYTVAVPIDGSDAALKFSTEPRPFHSHSVAERFTACFDPFPYPENVFYGVMRMSHLQRTRLLGAFGGSDRAFSAELSLYGRFVRIEQPLFRRRIQPAPQPEAEVQRYNAGRRVKYSMREWRILFWNLRSATRAPAPAEGRATLIRALARRLFVLRGVYAYELKRALATAVGAR